VSVWRNGAREARRRSGGMAGRRDGGGVWRRVGDSEVGVWRGVVGVAIWRYGALETCYSGSDMEA